MSKSFNGVVSIQLTEPESGLKSSTSSQSQKQRQQSVPLMRITEKEIITTDLQGSVLMSLQGEKQEKEGRMNTRGERPIEA